MQRPPLTLFELMKRLDHLEEENERLREQIKPFAERSPMGLEIFHALYYHDIYTEFIPTIMEICGYDYGDFVDLMDSGLAGYTIKQIESIFFEWMPDNFFTALDFCITLHVKPYYKTDTHEGYSVYDVIIDYEELIIDTFSQHISREVILLHVQNFMSAHGHY